jgi:hypothetical protein
MKSRNERFAMSDSTSSNQDRANYFQSLKSELHSSDSQVVDVGNGIAPNNVKVFFVKAEFFQRQSRPPATQS